MSSYLTTAYISPQSVTQFQDIANWRLADGSPAIGFVCIFAANYAADSLPFRRPTSNSTTISRMCWTAARSPSCNPRASRCC